VNTPTGWAWFFGDESYTEAWTEQTSNAGWMPRVRSTSVVMPDGSIILIGGYGGGVNFWNDTWRSTDNGATWTQMTANAEWPARDEPSAVAMPDGSIILMGGFIYGSGISNETWRSTDYGATWTQMTASAGWRPRQAHTSVVMPDGSIVLMGGIDSGSGTSLNDTWRSTDYGATWMQMTASAGWGARYDHTSVVMPDGSIVLMGGDVYPAVYGTDTWRSTDNGATWTQMSANGGWAGRVWPTSVAMPDGSIVLMGGWDGSGPALDDTWRSTDNGATWTLLNSNAEWPARFAPSSVAMPDGSIVLMGGQGEPGFMYYNDTWQLMPVGSSVQNPSHTYTLPGIYQVALQASNADGFSSIRKGGYITVGTPPAITPDAAVGDVVDTWYKGSVPPETSLQVSKDYVFPHEVMTLLDGTTIENPLDYTAWAVITDDDKNANLFHEVCYVFVNADDISSDLICAMSPPADASAFSYSNQGHIPNPAGRISSQFPPAVDPACSPDATNNYALLISGGIDKDHNYIRYYNDIAFLYKTLVKDYKYDKSRIKVLMSDGSANTANDLVASYTTATPPAPVYGNSNTDLDGDGSPETWNPATRSNVLSALGSYSNLGTSANLFIFTTSHGASTTNKADPNTNDVDLYLWGTGSEGKISDTDFVNALPANPKISMTMEQCNGGGFKDEFIPTSGTKTKILATAARGDKVSKSNDFSYYWITGVAGHDSLGYQANADTTNINGQVSMKEAFDYANYLDPSASLELPQVFDYAGGSGAGQYFSACSATPPGITVTTPAGAWTKGGTYKVTWSRTGTWPSPTPYVKVLLMKGAEPGLVQATISSSKLSSAGSTGASYLVPACLNGGPGTDYWIKIITNAVIPPISGRSSTFSVTGVSTCAKTTMWIKSLPDQASLGATIDIKDTNGVPVTAQEHYTNYQYTSVSPGTYYVKLAKTCFYNMLSPQSHTVIAGVPSTRTITLNPMPVLPGGTTCDNSLTGSIAIYSIPDEGYYVYIRSSTDPGFTDIGRNTPMIEEIGQGDYVVRLEADGYQSQEKPVTVTAGQQTRVTFELERQPGWSEFSGFYDPIDMGIPNIAKAGSTIPVIWHLADANGNDVSDPASFGDLVSYRVDCPGSGVLSSLSDATQVYPGSSGLQYLKEGNWQLNWKTSKNYAGTCRNMYIEFTSGQKSPEVTFQFKK